MRILVTGAGPSAYEGTIKSIGSTTFSRMLVTGLRRAGYEVDMKDPKEASAQDYSAVFCGLSNLRAFSAVHSPQMFKLLDDAYNLNKDVFWYLDDWAINKIVSSFRVIVQHYALWYAARLRNNTLDCTVDELKMYEPAIRAVVKRFLNDRKEPIVVPMFCPSPDMRIIDKLNRHPIVPVDPTGAYMSINAFEQRDPSMQKVRRWIVASLEDCTFWLYKQAFTWPVSTVGFPNTKQRCREYEVVDAYQRSWGAAVPAHSAYTGRLWRAHYVHARVAGCVTFTTSPEMRMAFPAHAIYPNLIEGAGEAELCSVAREQRIEFNNLTWSADRFASAMAKVVEG